MNKNLKKLCVLLLAGYMLVVMASCGQKEQDVNIAENDDNDKKIVNLFGPMSRANPKAQNASMTAQEKTVMMAEEQLNLKVNYRTYLAEDYKDKTYDDVTLERLNSNMDDFYLLNPDVIQKAGAEGKLTDLSGLDSAKNLRDVVKTANTVDGKLVAIPQEVVAYGLFVNKTMFDRYKLKLPDTPDELLECCETFKKKGIKTPIGANRWWLECFVLAQGYADLYNKGNTDAEIEDLNSGKTKLSDYMRPGFEYLKELIDKGYIDAKAAYTAEAIDGEGPDFLAQKTPIVMAYWGAANAETAYGKVDFDMQVIGFPSSLGQMPVISLSGYGVGAQAEHREDAVKVMDIMLSDEALRTYSKVNQVISPSKNVEVDCIDALKPLNDTINRGTYVLGSNASMKVEQWGNICLIVRDLLNGSSVDACMDKFDKLQKESLKK